MLRQFNGRNTSGKAKKSCNWQLCRGWLQHSAKILICLAFIAGAFTTLIWPQIKVNYLYASTRCLVLSSQLGPLSKLGRYASYQPKFLAMYAINNKIYTQWTYDILNNLVTNPAAGKAISQEFKLDHYYICWYDPADPHKVILKRGWDRISLLFFCMTLVVLGVSISQFRRWYSKRKIE